MKCGLGVSTRTYEHLGDKCYEKIREYGFTYIDYCMEDTTKSFYLYEGKEFEEKVLEEKRKIEQAGLIIWQVHGPWRAPIQDGTPEDRIERMEKMKKSIRATALMGCKYWVVHPIMPFGTRDVELGLEQETWDMNLTFMAELLQTAKENDVIICLENLPMKHFSISRPEDTLRFVKTINDDHFKICLDVGHVVVFNDLDIENVVYKLRDEIKVLHVHDNNGRYDLHNMPCFGIVDWKRFIESLREIEFDGVFALETGPSQKLSARIFDEMCRLMIETTKELLKE